MTEKELRALSSEIDASILDTMKLLSDTPSNMNQNNNANLKGGFDATFTGIKDTKALNMLFSNNLDDIISKMFDMVISGKFDSVLTSLDMLSKAFENNGVTDSEIPFQGEVTSSIMNVIQKSMQSKKFNNMKSKFRKIMLISKNLNRYVRSIKDPVERKKYEEAVFAISKLVKLANKIYKSRKMLSDKFLSGLNTLMNESENHEIIEIDLKGW